jgi:integrase
MSHTSDTRKGKTKVGLKHHLHQRDGAWYYRRRVPKSLMGSFGAMIQFSLGTTNLRKAAKLREIHDVEWTRRFEAAEAGHEPTIERAERANAHAKTLTEADAIQRVRAYVQTIDERRRKDALASSPMDSDERREWETELAIDLALARYRAPDYDHIEFVSREWEKIFPHADFAIDEKTFPRDATFDLVKRAAIELARRALARAHDDHRHGFFDRLFDPKQPLAVTVQELSEQYLTLKSQEGQARKIAQKTIDRQKANVALVREILGDETLVRDLNWDACMRFCRLLTEVPPNRTKIYPGVPLEEAIVRARHEGRETFSAVTQQQYLATLKELLSLAVKKDLIRVNYAEDLRPLTTYDLAADERRRPFEIEQLKALFESEFYRSCADAGDVPYRHADKGWRYWFPLLSLFTGMRPREIFQMHVDDLKRTDSGTLYLDIVATSDEDDANAPERKKTVKTSTSRRKIPLHPELVRLGFVSFADDQRTASSDPLLFRGLTRNNYGDPAAYPLKRFRETYLKPMHLKRQQAAYSFRHTWRDAARRIKASDDFLKAVGGWSGGKTTADVYGSKHHPDLYAEEVAKIGYEGLDLSHLYPKRTSA